MYLHIGLGKYLYENLMSFLFYCLLLHVDTFISRIQKNKRKKVMN